MVDLTEALTKQKIPVNLNKVVAGMEPDNTNIFLQAVHKAATGNLSDLKTATSKVLKKYGDDGVEENKKEPVQVKEEPIKK